MTRNSILILICVITLMETSGCASFLPVPGGNETVNESFYETKDDLLEKLEQLTVGMPQQEVFKILEHDEGQFQRLTRQEITIALLGTSNVQFQDGIDGQTFEHNFIQTLYGFRLEYQKLKRKHGFSSPIRIRTDKKGFDYSVMLIFREGVLFEKPILSGGMVNESSSKTFFDYINPNTVMNRVIK